ncbi:MAG: TonB-dependent hemoglobin/transferrin/lactoferrin family receptor [Neisseriaceae bacterium]|nr:TonB-dependent hemoglobin/transferrin/lactoferrin family receptor [Neisseriaceae bacterium]
MFFINQRHTLISLSVLMAFTTSAVAATTAKPDAAVSDVAEVNGGQSYQLPSVVVIGKRSGKGLVGKSILDQRNLDTQQANNVASLLETLPGVSMAGSPRPGGQTINMWGMGGSEDVPITVDGALKTFDKYRQGSVFVEPELLKRITVEKGPHEVSVGNGGFGGSVKLDTKDAADFLRAGEQFGGLLKYGRHSNNTQDLYTGALFGRTADNMFDAMMYYNKRQAGNVKRPDGTRFEWSSNKQDSLLLKGNIRPTSEQKITWSFMNSDHEGWEPFASKRDEMTAPTQSEVDKWGWDEAWKRKLVYRDQTDKSYSLAYEYLPVDNPLVQFTAKFTHSQTRQHDRRPDSASNFQSGNMGNESWVSYRNNLLDLANVSSFETGALSHDLKMGLQIQRMSQRALIFDKSKIKDPDLNFGYYEPYYFPSGIQKMRSFYVLDDIKLGSVTISPSLRYDHITNEGYGNRAKRYSQTDPKYGHDYSSKTYAGWTPRLGLYWEAAPNLGFFANVSQAWRAPRIDEQYEVQGLGSLTGSSRDLDKEKMLALRLGAVVDFTSVVTQDDSLQVRTTLFENRGKDEIFKRRGVYCKEGTECPQSTGNNRNLTGYTIKGFELESFYDSRYVFASLSYSQISGQRDNSPRDPWFESKTWLTEIAPRKATATLGFKVPQANLSAGWRGMFVRRQDRSPTDHDPSAVSWALPKSQGYALHGLFLDWAPRGKKGPQVNLTVDNLFNREYRPYLGEAVSGTGRDIRFSIAQQF